MGAVKVRIREIAYKPGSMRELTLSEPAPETWGEGLAQITEGTPIDLELRLESVHDGILVTADASTEMQAECGRCLRAFTAPLRVTFTELYDYETSAEDGYSVHGDHVNLTEPLRDAIVLALPFQPMDRPDCPGLDPETGELRADGSADDAPVDLRWAALEAFRDAGQDAPGTDAAGADAAGADADGADSTGADGR